MIGYPFTRTELRDLIDAAQPDWRTKARELTDRVVAGGAFPKKGNDLWTEIRSVFVELQGRKCAFCERDMAALPFGGNEQPVEHFRPKGRTKPWKGEATEEFWALVGDDLGDGREGGYYWLAYHEENYVTSCATCNSRLKSDYFPIFGTPGNPTRSPRQLASEKPALIFPVGDFDDDPSELITFRGIVPVPASTDPHARRRALVTIRFFALDTREELLEQRALALRTFWIAMHGVSHPDPIVAQMAEAQLVFATSVRAPHTRCVRAFESLAASNLAEAQSQMTEIAAYLASRGLA
jgi:hypothetical protein